MFQHSPRAADLQRRLQAFFDEHVLPAEHAVEEEIEANRRAGNVWKPLRVVEQLKPKAKHAGLWNLCMPHKSERFPDTLSNLEYAPLCEIMGRASPWWWASEIFNCNPPDSGNMETLELYATEEQKRKWLDPLAAGDIRSAFAMTEPDVASSDATNVQTRIERDGDQYVINGKKTWISGAADPRCKIFIVMGKTDPNAARHKQQSMILVPADTPGVKVVKPLTAFGYDDPPAGHCDLEFVNVRVPVGNILLGEGRGFEIAQGRLGPGRIHHCMRAIGAAERALDIMVDRAHRRVAFGRPLADQGVWRERIAQSRIAINQARLLVLDAAHKMDAVGNKQAAGEIAMIKVAVPNVAVQVIDWAIQVHGGAGLSDKTPLAQMYAMARALRFIDGPDEVHRNAIAKIEYARYAARRSGTG
jgi:acyl-CoA dehydrogenase